MQSWITSLSDRLNDRRALRRWARLAHGAEGLDKSALRQLRVKARQLRQNIDQVLFEADSRLALPALGSNVIQKPLHSDWAYRPEVWRGPLEPSGVASVPSGTAFGDEVKLFHDCPLAELTFRQVRNSRETDLAPFGMTLEVLGFNGTFVSLVVDVPSLATEGLHRNHIIRLSITAEVERPVGLFARLNIQHGPNTEQLHQQQALNTGEEVIEFDLAYSKVNEKRVEKMWVDLVFEDPSMNKMVLRDLTLCRHPRAKM
ncbi:DUF6478 family protein [Aliiroseovarius sp. F20344]|uniref:DUF6478 family protein n=1 Tax=Aliiroseovarius sp. F20344 TaxID=2926414 RepID=UPI001FF3D37F|nr:DUF6478 family protein [Aliiroseovarius sp. F20344]MCK0143982.1 DUF6478 family protein [Aliiroseovarius sp. F20344]